MSKVTDNDKEKRPMNRAEMMDRKTSLSHAHEAIQSVLRGDSERGYIDDETRDLLQAAVYQVIMAIDDNNMVWHVEDGGNSYPDNESAYNDFTLWSLEITSPINIGFSVMGRDHDFRP